MKLLITNTSRALMVWSLLSVITTATAYAQDPAKIDMSHLDKFADRADKVINVTVDEQLLRLAASFLSEKKPDEAKIKELILGLKGVFVKRFEFEKEGEFTITGDAGDYLGVLNDGASIHVTGNVGNYVGDNMTRGLIVVQGSTGYGAGLYPYGGTLVATNIGVNPLTAGDSLKLFSAASFAGAFSRIVPPMPGSGLAWDASGLTINGTLRVVAAAPPRISAAISDGSSFVLTGTGGIPNGTCYVLTSTNLTLPSAEWVVLATNLFDGSGNFAITNTLASDCPQQFFRLHKP